MKLKVTIYAIINEDKGIVGTISLDEQGLHLEPQGDPLLMTILREPVYDPLTRHLVRSVNNPQDWLRSLCYHFKSPYLYASKPVPDTNLSQSPNNQSAPPRTAPAQDPPGTPQAAPDSPPGNSPPGTAGRGRINPGAV